MTDLMPTEPPYIEPTLQDYLTIGIIPASDPAIGDVALVSQEADAKIANLEHALAGLRVLYAIAEREIRRLTARLEPAEEMANLLVEEADILERSWPPNRRSVKYLLPAYVQAVEQWERIKAAVRKFREASVP